MSDNTLDSQPATQSDITIAVMSDLHAYDKTVMPRDCRPSFMEVSEPVSSNANQISGLRKLIASEGIRSTFLLCPGDLGHQAHPPSVKHAWEAVHAIGSALNAEVIGTAGNHDVDSRHTYNSFDAKGYLQTLTPRFPIDDEGCFDRYWSRHFVILERPAVRFLIINSSAYHGVSVENGSPAEYEHGRIADTTLNAIRESLRTCSSNLVNVLLCHHHPISFDEHNLGSHDIINGGSALINMLLKEPFGEWLIVHGHKHFPRITYAQGTATAPIVFGAGSFSVALQADISAFARNQFYVLTISPADIEKHCGLVGRFKAWDWIVGRGWQPASDSSGIPAQGGFGIKEKPSLIASRVSEAASQAITTKWSAIEASVPTLRFLHPDDLSLVLAEIKEKFRFRVLMNDLGHIEQLDKQE